MRVQLAHIGIEPGLLIAARRWDLALKQLKDHSLGRFIERAEQRIEGGRKVRPFALVFEVSVELRIVSFDSTAAPSPRIGVDASDHEIMAQQISAISTRAEDSTIGTAERHPLKHAEQF